MLSMERIEQEMMVERYVRGELDEAMAAEFEAYFLDKPELIEQIEMAQLLKSGLAAMPDPSTAVDRARPWWQRLFGTGPGPAWAMACGVLVAVLVARETIHEETRSALQAPQANTPVLLLGAVRGDALAPTSHLDLAPGTQWFGLELELGWPEHENYGLIIDRDDDQTEVAQVSNLVPSAADTLMVTLPAARFDDGDYTLTVAAGTTEIARYRVRIQRLRN